MSYYYLIPTKWYPSGKAEMAVVANHWDWIREINCSHQKKQEAAQVYERELNKGALFSMEKVVQGQIMFAVLPTPLSQARDYNSFSRWPCNQDMF